MDDRRRGLTLIEQLVIASILAITLMIWLPVRSGCTISCRAQCQNNLKNIALALVQYSTTYNCYPNAGTFFDDPMIHKGDPSRSNLYQAMVDPAALGGSSNPCLSSWVVNTLPYLDQQDLYNSYNHNLSYMSKKTADPTVVSNFTLGSTSLGILRCPDDVNFVPGQGNCNYAVNGGFARWYPIPIGWMGSNRDGQSRNGGTLRWADDAAGRLAVGKKLGVMFLGSQSGDQPWDVRTTPADLTDGASTTIMMGESSLIGFSTGTHYSGGLPTNWACPLPNFSMFLASDDVCRSKTSETNCLAAPLAPGPKRETGAGWIWANQAGSFERMNYGKNLTVKGSFPFANSGHATGCNFATCDGSVKFITESIDGTIYARLITPGGEALPEAIRQGPLTGF